MSLPTAIERHHGVMLNYRGKGLFICGEAGIGKSSLGLELIHHGAILIVDDVVDFSIDFDQLVAHCPESLTGLLHTRELGLLDIRRICEQNSWQASSSVDLCIELTQQNQLPASLSTPYLCKEILGKPLVMLSLAVNNPASLKNRIDSWLAMYESQANSIENLQLWQLGKLRFSA